MKRAAIILFFFLSLSVSGLAQKIPNFSQYSARVENAKAKQVDLKSHSRARMFRTNLRNSLTEGVNFAGHFILAGWGCGTNCIDNGIIDARTGKVYFPKELEGVSAGIGSLGDKEPLEYKANSRLLVINGYPGGEGDARNPRYGIYYYEWTGNKFRLIRYIKKSSRPPQNDDDN